MTWPSTLLVCMAFFRRRGERPTTESGQGRRYTLRDVGAAEAGAWPTYHGTQRQSLQPARPDQHRHCSALAPKMDVHDSGSAAALQVTPVVVVA